MSQRFLQLHHIQNRSGSSRLLRSSSQRRNGLRKVGWPHQTPRRTDLDLSEQSRHRAPKGQDRHHSILGSCPDVENTLHYHLVVMRPNSKWALCIPGGVLLLGSHVQPSPIQLAGCLSTVLPSSDLQWLRRRPKQLRISLADGRLSMSMLGLSNSTQHSPRRNTPLQHPQSVNVSRSCQNVT